MTKEHNVSSREVTQEGQEDIAGNPLAAIDNILKTYETTLKYKDMMQHYKPRYYLRLLDERTKDFADFKREQGIKDESTSSTAIILLGRQDLINSTLVNRFLREGFGLDTTVTQLHQRRQLAIPGESLCKDYITPGIQTAIPGVTLEYLYNKESRVGCIQARFGPEARKNIALAPALPALQTQQ